MLKTAWSLVRDGRIFREHGIYIDISNGVCARKSTFMYVCVCFSVSVSVSLSLHPCHLPKVVRYSVWTTRVRVAYNQVPKRSVERERENEKYRIPITFLLILSLLRDRESAFGARVLTIYNFS